jgi:hypothetical protein
MGLDYLAYHAALTTAYRLLEGYGVLRLGDCVIQNNADSAVGVAVIQLCRMLRLSCINIVDDTERFEEVEEHLKGTFGATIVLRDSPQLPSVIETEILPKWSGVHRPRLAIDGVGADSGERLTRCLTEGCPLVTYATRGDNAPPHPRPMVVLAGQISLHTFDLAHWVSAHGGAQYVKMLEELSELVNGLKLQLDLRVLDCTTTGEDSDAAGLLGAHLDAVKSCLAVARGEGVAQPGSEFVSRPQLVLQLGTVRTQQPQNTHTTHAPHTIKRATAATRHIITRGSGMDRGMGRGRVVGSYAYDDYVFRFIADRFSRSTGRFLRRSERDKHERAQLIASSEAQQPPTTTTNPPPALYLKTNLA